MPDANTSVGTVGARKTASGRFAATREGFGAFDFSFISNSRDVAQARNSTLHEPQQERRMRGRPATRQREHQSRILQGASKRK
jgi:hypothetical protein